MLILSIAELQPDNMWRSLASAKSERAFGDYCRPFVVK